MPPNLVFYEWAQRPLHLGTLDEKIAILKPVFGLWSTTRAQVISWMSDAWKCARLVCLGMLGNRLVGNTAFRGTLDLHKAGFTHAVLGWIPATVWYMSK